MIASCAASTRGGYRDWPTQWFKAGEEYLERGARRWRADTADRRPDDVPRPLAAITSPATCITTSAGCAETRHSMLRAVEIYWEAAPLLSPPLLRLGFATATRPCGRLQLPQGWNGRLVVLIGAPTRT